MNDGSIRELSLTVEPRVLPAFFQFLQDGFLLEAPVGRSIREFLLERCGLSRETVEDRISTVFLDGKPVDDLDRTFVENNCTLALSGAMPGLVGAVMRSDSPLRSFRVAITHGVDEGSNRQQGLRGLVRLKLFNTVMSEFAHSFLHKGILLESFVVKDFVAKQLAHRGNRIRDVMLDGNPIDLQRLLAEDWVSGSALVSLSVETHG